MLDWLRVVRYKSQVKTLRATHVCDLRSVSIKIQVAVGDIISLIEKVSNLQN